MEKNIYPFMKTDGFVRPCKKGCPNCEHCTDVFWDYSNGTYHCECELHNEHEGCCKDYVNDGTEAITRDEFVAIKKSENERISNTDDMLNELVDFCVEMIRRKK